MRTGAKSSRSENVLKYDSFGTPINFNYADGSTEYRTGCGSCLSLIVLLFTVILLVNSLIVMVYHKGSNVSTFTLDSHFT